MRKGEGQFVRNSLKTTIWVVAAHLEKSISLLRQFFFCLVANVDYR